MQQLELEPNGGVLLADVVVKITSDAMTLVVLSFDQSRGQCRPLSFDTRAFALERAAFGDVDEAHEELAPSFDRAPRPTEQLEQSGTIRRPHGELALDFRRSIGATASEHGRVLRSVGGRDEAPEGQSLDGLLGSAEQ